MPFARGDMRDHIVSHKNDHGASYGRCAVLQWWSRLKSAFARFSASFNFRLLQHYLPKADINCRDCDVRSVTQGCRCTRSHFTYACGRIAEELCSPSRLRTEKWRWACNVCC